MKARLIVLGEDGSRCVYATPPESGSKELVDDRAVAMLDDIEPQLARDFARIEVALNLVDAVFAHADEIGAGQHDRPAGHRVGQSGGKRPA